MFASSDPNLPDLDFELVDERQQNMYLNEAMIKDILSSPTSTYRIVKPTNTTKRSGTNQFRRQLTDESPNKQRTPPNSTSTSLSPHSSSFLTRDTNPIRIANASNTLRMSSPATTKQLDSVTLLLKQTIAPAQLIPSVQTRLENPTKYHLEQISRKQTLVGDDSSLPTTTILPQEESSPDSEITSEMDDQLNDDATCGSIDSNTRGINITPRLSTTVTGDHVSSVFLSSSLSKDGLDSSSRHSSSCPTNILSAKAKIGLPLTEDEMRLVLRDRQKKDNHNMIERRRRFNINDRIKELGTLLPKGTDLDTKQNKGTILRASVDYIKILRRQYDNASLIDEKCHILAEQNLALQERVKELERKCLSNGIPINTTSSSTTIKSSPAIAVVNSNIIKQEPSSLSSSFNNNPLVPPSTPIFATFDSLPPLDSLSAFGIVDEDSNDTNSAVGNTSTDPLSPLTHDPFLSSTSFGFDNEMDIGGGFP
jgi:transcription factor E3